MILLLDAGNSFYKAAIYNPRKNCLQACARTHRTSELINSLTAFISPGIIQRALICSVLSASKNRQMQNVLTPHIKQIDFFRAHDYPLLPSRYASLRQLGNDRWAALLALYLQGARDYAVIDCGTAITVDIVRDGIHLGGLIAPGQYVFTHSLEVFTDGVHLDAQTPHNPIQWTQSCQPLENSAWQWGTDTQSAVYQAGQWYVCQFLQNLINHCQRQYSENFPFYISGCESASFFQKNNTHVTICDNLVWEGLRQLIIHKKL